MGFAAARDDGSVYGDNRNSWNMCKTCWLAQTR